MESFAVKCTCPEVTDILLQLAGKKGWDTTCSLCIPVSKVKWLRFGHVPGFSGECGRSDAVEYRDTWNRGALPIYSIEAAIAELSKPRPKPLMVAGRTLSFPGDGSVKLSCGTVISADVCDEIERRRGAKAETVFWTYRGWLHRVSGMEKFDGKSWVPFEDVHALSHTTLSEDKAKSQFPEAFTEAK